jgi:transcriptional regulator with XRE-family HTH domain
LKECLGSLKPARLAEESGIPPSTISRILSGDRKPTAEVIESIAPVLGIEPAQLVKDTDAEERYVKSGDFVKRAMYEAVVRTLTEYEGRINDLEGQLRLANERAAKDQTELGKLHMELSRVTHEYERVRDDHRLLLASSRDDRAALTRAITEIASLQAKLNILGEELGSTKQSARVAAILAGVAAFSGVVTVASLLKKDTPDPTTDEEDNDDE